MDILAELVELYEVEKKRTTKDPSRVGLALEILDRINMLSRKEVDRYIDSRIVSKLESIGLMG